jgi:hypothetical protein
MGPPAEAEVRNAEQGDLDKGRTDGDDGGQRDNVRAGPRRHGRVSFT